MVTPGRSACTPLTEMTVPELERARRDLRASLGLLLPGSPAHLPVTGQITAIDAELARRQGPPPPGPARAR